jgi:UDP-N-acetylmuramyl pentapeptide phosphotransferase/UDP-N-acetylglucosamine-1-phosphate transferase
MKNINDLGIIIIIISLLGIVFLSFYYDHCQESWKPISKSSRKAFIVCILMTIIGCGFLVYDLAQKSF